MMKATVMGAGGIGGYIGGRLAQAGVDVTLIARGAHLEALKSKGLRIDAPGSEVVLTEIRACASPAEAGPTDLVLFTVKLFDTDAAAENLHPLLGEETRVLTLQNGIDGPSMLERHLGTGRCVAGVAYLSASIREPGVIAHPGGVHHIIADSMMGNPVMAELFALSDRLQDLDIEPSGNPKQMLWNKFVNIASFSGITCLARSPLGAIYENAETLEFGRKLLSENVTVARAEGLSFADDYVEKTFSFFRDHPHGLKSSMLLDLEAGKPLELPWLGGRICQLAATHGIDVPANQAVVAALAPFVGGQLRA